MYDAGIWYIIPPYSSHYISTVYPSVSYLVTLLYDVYTAIKIVFFLLHFIHIGKLSPTARSGPCLALWESKVARGSFIPKGSRSAESRSAEPSRAEPSGAMETPHFRSAAGAAGASVSYLYHTAVLQDIKCQPRHSRSCTSRSSFCDGRGRCFLVRAACACLCHVSCRPTAGTTTWTNTGCNAKNDAQREEDERHPHFL